MTSPNVNVTISGRGGITRSIMGTDRNSMMHHAVTVLGILAHAQASSSEPGGIPCSGRDLSTPEQKAYTAALNFLQREFEAGSQKVEFQYELNEEEDED